MQCRLVLIAVIEESAVGTKGKKVFFLFPPVERELEMMTVLARSLVVWMSVLILAFQKPQRFAFRSLKTWGIGLC
jgi:hypothetical protein